MWSESQQRNIPPYRQLDYLSTMLRHIFIDANFYKKIRQMLMSDDVEMRMLGVSITNSKYEEFYKNLQKNAVWKTK